MINKVTRARFLWVKNYRENNKLINKNCLDPLKPVFKINKFKSSRLLKNKDLSKVKKKVTSNLIKGLIKYKRGF